MYPWLWSILSYQRNFYSSELVSETEKSQEEQGSSGGLQTEAEGDTTTDDEKVVAPSPQPQQHKGEEAITITTATQYKQGVVRIGDGDNGNDQTYRDVDHRRENGVTPRNTNSWRRTMEENCG